MEEVLQKESEGAVLTGPLQNILYSTQQLIDHADPTKYVSTYAERSSYTMLKTFGCVFIKGRSGTGKSRLGLTLLTRMTREHKCKPFMLTSPQNWKLIPHTDVKYAVMIDDIFGSSNLALSQVDKWERLFDVMWASVESGNIFFVITIRPEILAQCMNRLKKYTLISRIPYITLDEDNYRLKPSEKEKFLRKYCGKWIYISDENVVLISNIHTSLGFPQCCEFMASNKQAQNNVVNFFENPTESMKEVISAMMEGDPLGYFVLQLVMLNNGCLEYDHLKTFELSSHLSNLLAELSNISYLSRPPTRGQIRNKADSLCGVYLCYSDYAYQFQHQSLFDTVFLDLAKEYPDICIRHCSAKMLVELVRTEDPSAVDSGVLLYLTQDMYDELADRITNLLQSESAIDIWDHPSLQHEAFLQNMIPKWDENELNIIMSQLSVYTPRFSRENYLPAQHNFLVYEISKKNETIAKLLVLKLEDLQQEYGKYDALVWAIANSLSELVQMLLDTGINLGKKCLRALCYSKSIADSVLEYLLNRLDIQSCSLSDEEAINLFALASFNGNIGVATSILKTIDADNNDLAFDCLWAVCDEMRAEIIPMTKLSKIECLIKVLLSYDFDKSLLANLLPMCCCHLYAVAIKTVLEKEGEYSSTDWITFLDTAIKDGGAECVQVLLESLSDKEDVAESLRDFVNDAAITHTDSGAKMRLLLQNFNNVVTVASTIHTRVKPPLHFALRRGNLDVVSILTSEGVDVNVQDWNGESLLQLAVMGRHTNLVKELLDAGADVNMRDYCTGNSVLLTADDYRIIRMLVEAGSDVNDANKRDLTALLLAAERNDLDTVRFLCMKGSDVSHSDVAGRSVLHISCKFGDVDMIKYVCEKGAKPSLNKNGQSLLHYCAQSESDAMENVQYVIDIHHVLVDVEDSCGRTPLFLAVRSGDMEVIMYLIEKGANLKHRDKNGISVIHAVCAFLSPNSLHVIKFLCSAGVDPDLCNNNNKTALHVALTDEPNSSVYEIITFLIEKMSNMNQADSEGSTPLHMMSSNFIYMELLLQNGAESCINQADNTGQTPLHMAVRGSNFLCMRLLLESGADRSIDRTDNSGQTALQIATANKFATSHMSLLLENGAQKNVNHDINFGQTMLHLAAGQANDYLMRLLLERGATESVNKVDKNGRSPLHLAVETGSLFCVKLLLDAGSNKHLKDGCGKAPIQLARRKEIKDLLEKREYV